MNNISIRPRLSLLVGALLALLVLSIGLGVVRLKASNEALGSIYNDQVVPLKRIKAVADGYFVGTVDTAHKVLNGSLQPDDGIKGIEQARAEVATEWKAYTETHLTPEETALIAEATPLMKGADAAGDRLAELLKAKDLEGVRQFAEKDMYPVVDPLDAVLERLTQLQLALAAEAYQRAEAHYATVLWQSIASGAVVLGLAAWLSWAMIQSIVRPLGQAVAVAERVAAGDLRSRIEVQGRDEASQLLAALQRMNASLTDIVGRVRHGSDSIATGSAQIATGNADLSQRTEEQASHLQQTAASMEQLTATVRQNADTPRAATELASSASQAAAQGGELVGQVTSTMDQITESSRRIGDIIGVIDGIAFQTNILALNAAVEAARAGEHGRGFAVVAGEVRSLAQRCANAAKEIKHLIGASTERVEAGSALVVTAGDTMGDIVQRVRRVSDMIGEISTASTEQSSGIGQIGTAVSQLDQVTQQNAALVEQSAAAAESLKHQATQLAKVVAEFQV